MLPMNPHDVSPQALAVAAYLCNVDGIENSWNDEQKKYDAEMHIVPFYNCRERGFIVYDMNFGRDQRLAAIFCEHRNSDSIVCSVFHVTRGYPVEFEQFLEQLPADSNKWTMWQKSFDYGRADLAAQWIIAQFEADYL